jgi:hypothetical protein
MIYHSMLERNFVNGRKKKLMVVHFRAWDCQKNIENIDKRLKDREMIRKRKITEAFNNNSLKDYLNFLMDL